MKNYKVYLLLILLIPALNFAQGSGSSLDFNGSNQIVNVPSLSTNIGNSDFTVECFAKFDSFSDFPDSQSIFNYGTGLRYVMTKAFNTRVGIDVAWANPNSQFGWYIVIGTSF